VDAPNRVSMAVMRRSPSGGALHTRRTCRNPHADIDANYKGDVVKVEDLLDGLYVPGHQPYEVTIHSSPQFTDSFALCSY